MDWICPTYNNNGGERKGLSMLGNGPSRKRDISKRTLMEVEMKFKKNCTLYEDMDQDTVEWWARTYVAKAAIIGIRLWEW